MQYALVLSGWSRLGGGGGAACGWFAVRVEQAVLCAWEGGMGGVCGAAVCVRGVRGRGGAGALELRQQVPSGIHSGLCRAQVLALLRA